MRTYLLVAAATAALVSTPALARDGAPYVGIEGGIVASAETEFDVDGNFDGPFEFDDAFEIDFKRGLDVDLIAGYDFGLVRAEAELGYKRVKADDVNISTEFANELGIADDDFDISGTAKVTSLMGNVLLDFGNQDGLSFYAGGGLGRARVKMFGDKDSAWAWQLIAGARYAVSSNVDLGLKYRYFQTGRLRFEDDFDTDDGFATIGSSGKFRSHSLLASLIFNFGGAAEVLPPPPPPPPPPPEPERG